MDRIALLLKCLRYKPMNIVQVMWGKNANFLPNMAGNAYWFSYPDRMSGYLEDLYSQVNSLIIEKQ